MANEVFVIDEKKYPFLSRYCDVLELPDRPVLGRDKEIRALVASLHRVEMPNPILLGPAGVGKTTLVRGAMPFLENCLFLAVDLPGLAVSDNGEDGALEAPYRLKTLFSEVEQFRLESEEKAAIDPNYDGYERIVLFMDEFHMLVELSSAAVEAVKPLLASSGEKGINLISATTFEEYQDIVAKNTALMQRLQRLTIREPDKDVVIGILKSIVAKNVSKGVYVDPSVLDLVYEYANRYKPSEAQPRKSINILDEMIGWHLAFGEPLNRDLLAAVIYESSGVNVNFHVDALAVRELLNERVFNQEVAASMIERRLQISVADLNDTSRPMGSFLFTGSTGVGKTEMAKGLATILFGSEDKLLRFDMSEFAQADSIERFREGLTTAVWENPYSIVLLDEVEKADSSITRLLLQVLDDARLSDRHGRIVTFNNTYFILTTNAGAEIFQDIGKIQLDNEDTSVPLDDYMKLIRKALQDSESFPAELINRMDAFIPFRPLTNETFRLIGKRKLEQLALYVKEKHNKELIYKGDVLDYLVNEDFGLRDTDGGGARGLVNRMNFDITSLVARYINTHSDVKRIGVAVIGSMRSRNKTQRRSAASIIVGPYNG